MASAKTKKPTYQDLLRQNMELKGQMANAYAFAAKDIAKASTDHLMSSGVLLQLNALGGRQIIEPILIRDGLSPETIEALKKDLARSFELATAHKL